MLTQNSRKCECRNPAVSNALAYFMQNSRNYHVADAGVLYFTKYKQVYCNFNNTNNKFFFKYDNIHHDVRNQFLQKKTFLTKMSVTGVLQAADDKICTARRA